MKIKAIILMAMAWVAAHAAENMGARTEHRVTVCMEVGTHLREAVQAQALASRIFAGIGVTIAWHTGLHGCPARSIIVGLSEITSPDVRPGALAYALPFEGTHIVVFYDRIEHHHDQTLVAPLLGHVLVHEITHILQDICRHSDRGIMKAHWNTGDYYHMTRKPMEFEGADIDLIYRGLAKRTAVAAQ